MAVNPPKSFVGSLPPFTVAEKRAARQRAIGMLLPIKKSTSFSRTTDASPATFTTNAESYSVRFASRGMANRKCTALANVGVMLIGLRPTGGDVRASTKPIENAERQRRDSSRRIGSHPNVEKTVRIQPEIKPLQTHKLPLSYSGTPGPGEPLSSSRRT